MPKQKRSQCLPPESKNNLSVAKSLNLTPSFVFKLALSLSLLEKLFDGTFFHLHLEQIILSYIKQSQVELKLIHPKFNYKIS